MSSVSKLVLLAAVLLAGVASFASLPPLRVCADPSNLPFSNVQEQGFENVLAKMIARDLQRDIQFIWWPQRARFAEKWLKTQACELVMAMTGSEYMVSTRPYYRSTYVFVSRLDRAITTTSLTDASLKKYRVGAQIVGDDDGAMVPPADEMAKRGMRHNLVGYSLYGRPLDDNPSAEIVSAVERGDVDMAIAWGPLAGYFASLSPVPLRLAAICPLADRTAEPFQFDISMGVRRGDDLLLEQLNNFIVRHQAEIHKLLTEYGVPLVDKNSPAACR